MYKKTAARKQKNKKALQSLKTRERILAAATRLFARKGYHATTISELAGSVKMTKGALYHHFRSKEAIFFAVMAAIRRSWRDSVAREVLGAGDPMSRLIRLLDSHAGFLLKNESFCLVMNTLMMEMTGVNPSLLAAIRGIYGELGAFIERIIRKAQASKSLRPDLDARLAALSIIGMFRGIGCSRPLFAGKGIELPALMQTMKEMLVAGLRRQSPAGKG